MTEPESAEQPEQPDAAAHEDAAGERRPALVLAVSLAVVFGAAAAVLALLLASGGGEDERLDDLRRTAGQFAEALVTYDHRDPESHREAVLGFATGSFREEYEDAFDQGLAQIIAEVEAVSRGFVKDVYVSEIDEERAQAVVAVDIEHDGAGGPRTLFDIYFRLTFVEVDGEWLVDQVTDLNFGTGTPGAAPATSPEAPTSTTASVP